MTHAEAKPARKASRARQNKKWRERNAQQLQAKRRAWYLANKEAIAVRQKKYRAELPREIVLERRKRHAFAHKKRETQRYHATRAFLPWLNAFRGSKQRAKKHLIAFSLTKEWCASRWTGCCEVTKLPFVLSTSRSPYLFSPSIDRIVPSLGYTTENSRFVLHAVNALKGAGTDADMLSIAKAITASLESRTSDIVQPRA